MILYYQEMTRYDFVRRCAGGGGSRSGCRRGPIDSSGNRNTAIRQITLNGPAGYTCQASYLSILVAVIEILILIIILLLLLIIMIIITMMTVIFIVSAMVIIVIISLSLLGGTGYMASASSK